jgi:hypothetical protein
MKIKTFEVQVTATIIKWFKVEAKNKDEAMEIAYEGFDCEPSIHEKYYQEVGEIKEV